MKGEHVLKLAVSVIALTSVVGCTQHRSATRLAPASTHSVKGDAAAANANAKMEEAARKQDWATALGHGEDAVAAAPGDLAYRMILADLYVKNGRFASAATTYRDVLQLNPGNVRASLNLALAEIASGRPSLAATTLESVAGTAPAANVGLAFALSGQPQRAIEILEPAARAEGADARVRQNLALAYALAGDWQKARVIAAQDVPGHELEQRLGEWAALAKPDAGAAQVAYLLGVTPVADAGQPVRLALSAPRDANVQVAVAPVAAPAPVAETVPASAVAFAAPEPQPVQVAQAAPVAQPAPIVQPVQIARPAPMPQPAPMVASKPRIAAAAAAPKAAPRAVAPAGRYVIQLGAFRSKAQVNSAWNSAVRKYRLAGKAPVTASINVRGQTFHRLAVRGFVTRGEAVKACSTVRARGGDCFVRGYSGGQPVRMAARSTRGA